MYHNVALSVDDEVRRGFTSLSTVSLGNECATCSPRYCQVFTWGSNINGCLGRPEELAGLEELFCAVPARVEGMDSFVGRPCSSKCLYDNMLRLGKRTYHERLRLMQLRAGASSR